MLKPTPFPDLNDVLHQFVVGAQAVLGAAFTAAYLQGSFGVGDFDSDSDVDFMIVVEQDLSADQLAALQALHGRIYDLESSWAQHLEGSYFPKDLLRQADLAKTPLWYLDNTSRELVRSDHDNTRVVRWVTRAHGIPLAGPDAKTLIDPVSADSLRQEVRHTMQAWATEIFGNPGAMDNGWYQPYAVVSYCRMLQTLETGRIESKLAGVTWAKQNLDHTWLSLIERAWAARPNPSLKIRQKANPVDFESTLKFIQYALEVGTGTRTF